MLSSLDRLLFKGSPTLEIKLNITTFPHVFFSPISLIKILQEHAFVSCEKGLTPGLLLILTLFAIQFSPKPPSQWMLGPITLPIHILGGKKLVQKNSSILGSFADFTRLAKSTPVVLSGFPFLIIGFWQRGGKRKIFIKRSSPDNEFSSPFECICGMPEWFITADSEVWQWAAEMTDGIFFLISFPWSSSSLGLCTSIN